MTHEHTWRRAGHFDACHWYSSAYACTCGAVLSQWQERKFAGRGVDPYSTIWADYDTCDRCKALLAGAKRKRKREHIDMPKQQLRIAE